MKHWAFPTMTAVLVLVLLLAGCGGGGGGGGGGASGGGGLTQSGTIGTAGGTIAGSHGYELRIPAGTLGEDVYFTMQYSSRFYGAGVPEYSRVPPSWALQVLTSKAVAPGALHVRWVAEQPVGEPELLVAVLHSGRHHQFVKPRVLADGRTLEVPCHTQPWKPRSQPTAGDAPPAIAAGIEVMIGRSSEALCDNHRSTHVTVCHYKSQAGCSYAEEIRAETESAYAVYAQHGLGLGPKVRITVNPSIGEPRTNYFGDVEFPVVLPSGMGMTEACAHELVHVSQATYNIRYLVPQPWFTEATAVAVAAEYSNGGQLALSPYYWSGVGNILRDSFTQNSHSASRDYYKYHLYSFLAFRERPKEPYATLKLVRDSYESLKRSFPWPMPPPYMEFLRSLTSQPGTRFSQFCRDFAVLGQCPTYGPQPGAMTSLDATIGPASPSVTMDGVLPFSARYLACEGSGLERLRFEGTGLATEKGNGWRIHLFDHKRLVVAVELDQGAYTVDIARLYPGIDEFSVVAAYVPTSAVEGRLIVTAEYESQPPNRAPTITEVFASPHDVPPGTPVTVTCTASDPDGDPLTYSWFKTAGGISGSGSEVTWTAPASVGAYTVTCTVSDPAGLKDSGSVDITVTTTDIVIE